MRKTLLKQIMKPINLLFYSILASIVVMFFVLFNTAMGLKFGLKAVEKFSAGALIFEGASGTLGQTIHLKKMIYTQPQQVARLENVTLKWSPLALLEWHLQIDQFSADKLIVTQKTLKTSQKLLKKPLNTSLISLPQLPIYLVVKKLHIGEVRVNSGGRTTYRSKNLKANIALTRTRLEGQIFTSFILPVSVNGRLELSGNKNHYEFQLNFFGKDFHWKLVGQGDQTHLVFNTLQDDLLKGKLNLNGWIKSPLPSIHVKPSSPLSPKPLNTDTAPKEEDLLLWKFSLTASNLHLDEIFPVLLNGALTGEGKGKEGRLVLNLAGSRYYQQPIDGQAMLRFDYPLIKSFNAEIFSGKNTLSVNGDIGDEWGIHWKANIDNLKLWFPSIQGSLVSQGGISGKRESPQVQANLFMRELKTETVTVKSLRADTTFNMEFLDNSQVILEAQQIKGGIFEVSNLTFSGNLKETSNGVWIHLKLQPGIFRYPLESKMQTESFGGGGVGPAFYPGKDNYTP